MGKLLMQQERKKLILICRQRVPLLLVSRQIPIIDMIWKLIRKLIQNDLFRDPETPINKARRTIEHNISLSVLHVGAAGIQNCLPLRKIDEVLMLGRMPITGDTYSR